MQDVLQVANGMAMRNGGSPVFSTSVATPTGADVIGFGGAPIRADAALSGLGNVDAVVLPPVLDGLDESIATQQHLITWLKERADDGVVLASVCTGAYFLAEAGLLDGRRATTYPGRATSFRRRYPNVTLDTDFRVIDEGQVITSGATTSYLDLALHLVERHAGHAVSVVTAKVLAVDKNRLTQRPYFLFADQREHGDETIRAVQDWIDERHREEMDIGQLATRFAMSVRTLNRRFRLATGEAPVSYLHRVRIESAKRLLDENTLNIDEITGAVGYSDARSFARLFRRQTGMSPGEYRRRFGVTETAP